MFKIGLFSNKFVVWALVLSIGALFTVFYVPFLQGVFQFALLSLKELGIIILLSSSVLLSGEIYKRIKYRKL